MTWNEFLGPYQPDGQLLSDTFMLRWGGEPWNPSAERRAGAAKLHTQITSRIATQRLGYLDGVEKSALDSVFALFQKTRDTADQHSDCRQSPASAMSIPTS